MTTENEVSQHETAPTALEKLRNTHNSLSAQYASVLMQLRRLESQERELSGALQIVGVQLAQETEANKAAQVP